MYNWIKKPCKHVVRSVQLMKLCQFNDGDTDLHILARKASSNKYYEKAIRYRLSKNTVDELNDNGLTPIMVAAQCGNETFLKLRLKFPVDVNFAINNGHTALHYAVHYSHAQCVSILLAKGAHLNKKTESGNMALHIATSAKKINCLRILLESGIDVNEKNERGYTSLHKAAENGDIDSIKLLLENEASINTLADEGVTALYLAANAGHKAAVEVLIDSGADINLGQRTNYPLFGAAAMGYANIVLYLIEKGANPYQLVNTENETFTYSVVHAASVGGSVELLKNLELGGFEMDLPEERSCTPLMLAIAKSDSVECIEFLLERTTVQCDNVRTKEENQTLLHLSMNLKDKPKVVEILLNNNADPNAMDNLGMTPVMLASKYGRCESLKILLQRGGDPRLQARNGLTALHIACMNGCVDCVNELLNAKVEVNAVTNYMGKKCTALDLCNESDRSNKEMCIKILKKASGDTYENLERITSSIRHSRAKWKLPA